MTPSPPAHAGESLDALVFRAIGSSGAAVDLILAADRGLAEIALALPEGTIVNIPDAATAPPAATIVQLWDA